MNTGDLTSIVTAIVAVIGLGFSIYNFYIGRRDRRPALIAKISNGFLTYGPELSEPMLLLEVANPGEKKVIVSGVHIAWGKQTAFFPHGIPGTKAVPFELLSGEGANFWTPLKEFALALHEQGAKGRVKVKACFTDGVGNKYCSKNFGIDITGWAKN